MYGRPQIARPPLLQDADAAFIRDATAGLGSREAASKVWFAQAERFLAEGNLDFAMHRYNQSWLLDPNNYQPYWGFGRWMLQQDRPDEAIGHFEQARQRIDDPFQLPALLSDAGVAHSYKAAGLTSGAADRLRAFALANEHFSESARLDPSYAPVWYRWAQSLHREGKFAEAWDKLKRARSAGARIAPEFTRELERKLPEPK
ncbi:MAG: hypothetical protein FJX53_14170 [Alphaproteobacteria bacterium]|nr:hypothetical protein [Alphaproteobacteria bacterium]